MYKPNCCETSEWYEPRKSKDLKVVRVSVIFITEFL